MLQDHNSYPEVSLGVFLWEGLGEKKNNKQKEKKSLEYILGILETVSHVLLEKGTKHFYVVVNNKPG